jgi:hypothetical protein
MANGLKTQGTHLYLVDRSGTPALVKMECPTGIQGVTDGARDQIEDTCLDNEDDKTYVAGLANPSTVTVPFILNPQAASHQLLFDLKATGEMVDWIALLSDGTAAPTLSVGNEITPPTTRSSFMFEGFVTGVAIDIATNEVVRGTLTIQRSGGVTATWKTP